MHPCARRRNRHGIGRPSRRRGQTCSVMQASSGSAMLLDVSEPPAPPSERWSANLFQQPGVVVPVSPCTSDASASTAFWSSPISSQTMILQPEDIMIMPNSPLDNSPAAAQTDPAYTRLLAKLQRQSAQRRMLYGSAASYPAQRSCHRPADAAFRVDRVATAPLEREASTSLPPSRLQRGACGTILISRWPAHDAPVRWVMFQMEHGAAVLQLLQRATAAEKCRASASQCRQHYRPHLDTGRAARYSTAPTAASRTAAMCVTGGCGNAPGANLLPRSGTPPRTSDNG